MKLAVKKQKVPQLLLTLALGLIVFVMLSSFIFKMMGNSKNTMIEEEISASIPQVIQVNVLNACGVDGLASETKHFLRSRGFDVVEVANYKENVENSIVIDRLGDREAAVKVAESLGIPDSLVITEIDSTLFLRSSVILGKDYQDLKPFN